MDIKTTVTNLDKIAEEVQTQDPKIALALDLISDKLEKTAGFLDEVKGFFKKMNPFKAVEFLVKNNSTLEEMVRLLEPGLSSPKQAFKKDPEFVAKILSAVKAFKSIEDFKEFFTKAKEKNKQLEIENKDYENLEKLFEEANKLPYKLMMNS